MDGAEIRAANSVSGTLQMVRRRSFARLIRPWQRGSNENANGLLRQYFPTSTNLNAYGPEDLEHIAQELNARPRKTLGWDSRPSVFVIYRKPADLGCCIDP